MERDGDHSTRFPCRGYQGDIVDTWSHLFPIVGIGMEEYPLSGGGGETGISCRGERHKPTRAYRFPIHQNVFSLGIPDVP